MKNVLYLTLLLACLIQSTALNAADLVLVENGQPRAEIVVSATRPRMTTLAALELRHFIERISGARLPLVTSSGQARISIHVGESEETKRLGVTSEGLRHGAYRIVSGAAWLVLLGPDRDFNVSKMPWPLDRKDVPRAEMEWRKITASQSEAEWGFPFASGFKSYWNPADFTDQMTARYGDDFRSMWQTTSDGKPGLWLHDQAGSLNAVHDLLRRLGSRFYMPGELGEVLPKTSTLAIPALNETVRPDFAMRDWNWYNFAGFTYDDVIWARRIGMNSCDEALGPLKGPHGMVAVMSSEVMKAKHPDYYAFIGGQRDTGHREKGTPCFSSSGLEDETARYIRFLYDTFDVPSVDIWPVDGLRLCQCEKCEGQSASDLVWGFADRVARQVYQSHPTKRVTCGAYTSYVQPPSSEAKLSPNLAVWISNAGRPLLTDDARWEKYTHMIESWRSHIAPGNLLRLENNRYHIFRTVAEGISYPVLHPRAVARDLKMLKGISAGDTGEQSQVNGTWRAPALEHITLYVQSRFLWDADQDVDAVLRDYCLRFYGPAADQMYATITFAEQNLAFKDQSRSRGRANPFNVALPIAIKFRDMLDTARRTAGDTVYGSRIQSIIDSLQPRDELIAQNQKREQDLADARANAPIANPGTEFRLKDNNNNRPTTIPTTFRVNWESNALVLDIVCHEPELTKLNIASEVYNGDCVAISIETPHHSYYHIEINPNGQLFEGNPSGDWKSLAEVKAERGADSWRLHVRLPVVNEAEAASDPKHRIAGQKPTAAAPWYFNIGRQRALDLAKPELQAFSPTQTGWHVPTKFGKLVIQ